MPKNQLKPFIITAETVQEALKGHGPHMLDGEFSIYKASKYSSQRLNVILSDEAIAKLKAIGYTRMDSGSGENGSTLSFSNPTNDKGLTFRFDQRDGLQYGTYGAGQPFPQGEIDISTYPLPQKKSSLKASIEAFATGIQLADAAPEEIIRPDLQNLREKLRQV